MKKCVVFLYIVVLVLGIVNIVGATPLIATFDSFREGTYSFGSFTDGGITFSNLYVGNDIGRGTFVVESTDSSNLNSPFFSPPNYLTTIGYSPGPGASFGRFGSADITFGSAATAASLEIFYGSWPSQNILTMQALLNGTIVGNNFIEFNISGQGILHQTLAISGVTFDTLKLIASGPQANGFDFIGIDNVKIEPVPEPSTILLLGSGLVGLVGFRRKFKN